MYDPTTKGTQLSFGISGLLYRNTVVLYDHETRSLWSQVSSAAIGGPLQGMKLRKVPFTDTTWGEWRRKHPDTLVLSEETGYQRTYGLDPYALNRTDVQAAPPIARTEEGDWKLHPQELVYGIELGGAAKAYPVSQLRAAPIAFTDNLDGTALRIVNNPPGENLEVRQDSGDAMPAMKLSWLAWSAIFPETELFHISSDE